jgi:AcrR family transcriptional regulator
MDSYGDAVARMSPEDRRTAILDAALAVMQRRGIAGTTVRDVAHEMGTSSGLIHHYYESMDELVAEAFARAAGDDLLRMREALTASDAVGRLSQLFSAYSRNDGTGTMQLWLDAWADAARRPALQVTSRRLNRAWQQLLAGIIADGVRDGSMRCADPDAAAWRLLSLLDGLALQTVAHRGTLSRRQADEWARRSAELELALPPESLRPDARRSRQSSKVATSITKR